MLSKRLDEAGLDEAKDEPDDRGKRWPLGALLRAALGFERGTLIVRRLFIALFRSVTQRTDQRRAVSWKTLMSELAFALVTTTDDELRATRHLPLS